MYGVGEYLRRVPGCVRMYRRLKCKLKRHVIYCIWKRGHAVCIYIQIGTGVLLKDIKYAFLANIGDIVKTVGSKELLQIQYAKKGKFKDKLLYVRVKCEYIGLLLWFNDILLYYYMHFGTNCILTIYYET